MLCLSLILGEQCWTQACFHQTVCCAPAAGCSWMQWPVCWSDEASAPGLGQTLWVFNSAGCYLNLEQAENTLQPEAAARERQACSWGPAWLISQSPEVLHSWASSLLSQEAACYFISTSLKGQHRGEVWMEGRKREGGAWSLLPSPEASHMEITASCQLSVFCAAIIFPCFLQNKGKAEKRD